MLGKCLTDAGFEVVPGVQLLRIQPSSLMNFIRVENSTTSYLTPLRENREAISIDPVYTRYDTSTHCQLQAGNFELLLLAGDYCPNVNVLTRVIARRFI